MLKTILSISGRPGLFKRVSQGKNMVIVESLADKKRTPAYSKDKMVSLGDIAMYTSEAEVPLYTVLAAIKERENGEKTSPELLAAKPDDLRSYLENVLPNFDRDRVYPSDIRKLLVWYNLLVDAGITDFSIEDKKEEVVVEIEEEKAIIEEEKKDDDNISE